MNTVYAHLSESYANRDAKIAERVAQVCHQSFGKRVLMVVGLDHKSYLEEYFE